MNTNAALKDFEIISELGKGAFGYVYKVKRLKDGEIYALKKVYMNKLKSKEKENSLNEIRILASINHCNVISYKEAFYDNASNCICIIMEYADCGDLEKKINGLIKKKAYMTESEIISYFLQIIQGLKALHDKKILHRDIKAANIFLFEGDVVKIGDLNVSKVIKTGMLYTQTGTPYYASPEVWNDKPYDYKSDIWSLGCLLYEMTTLKAPFRGTTMKGVYEKVMKGVYDPIPTFYSKTLANIINSMLQINHNNRPTCEQLTTTIIEKMKNLKLSINISSLQNTAPPLSEDLKSNTTIKNEKLLKTIKVPKKMNELNLILPKSKYRKRVKSSINPASDIINKTEISNIDLNISENIKDKTIVYQKKNDKLVEDLFDDSILKPKNYVRPHSVNPHANYNKENDRSNILDKSILIPDINISNNDNPSLDIINKPILIKKKISLKKSEVSRLLNMRGLINLNITPKHINSINNSKERINSNLYEKNNQNGDKKILSLKNNYYSANYSSKDNLALKDLNQKNFVNEILNTEDIGKSLFNVTPQIIKKDRPSSVIDTYQIQINRANRNNSSNIKRILQHEPSISPKYQDKSAIILQNDYSMLLDNSCLPKIHKIEKKIKIPVINLFNQTKLNLNNINYNSNGSNNTNIVKILNTPKIINQRAPNFYPIKIEKDKYNFEIKDYNINADALDGALKNMNKPIMHKIQPKLAYHINSTSNNANSANQNKISLDKN